jgi:hypothetical protein
MDIKQWIRQHVCRYTMGNYRRQGSLRIGFAHSFVLLPVRKRLSVALSTCLEAKQAHPVRSQ